MANSETKKVDNRKGALTLVAFTIIVAIFFSFNSSNNPNFTVEDYWKIEEGMTYGEVVEILNEEGAEVSKQHISESVTTSTYQFSSDSGGYAFISFKNKVVTGKSQSNLKKEGE